MNSLAILNKSFRLSLGAVLMVLVSMIGFSNMAKAADASLRMQIIKADCLSLEGYSDEIIRASGCENQVDELPITSDSLQLYPRQSSGSSIDLGGNYSDALPSLQLPSRGIDSTPTLKDSYVGSYSEYDMLLSTLFMSTVMAAIILTILHYRKK